MERLFRRLKWLVRYAICTWFYVLVLPLRLTGMGYSTSMTLRFLALLAPTNVSQCSLAAPPIDDDKG